MKGPNVTTSCDHWSPLPGAVAGRRGDRVLQVQERHRAEAGGLRSGGEQPYGHKMAAAARERPRRGAAERRLLDGGSLCLRGAAAPQQHSWEESRSGRVRGNVPMRRVMTACRDFCNTRSRELGQGVAGVPPRPSVVRGSEHGVVQRRPPPPVRTLTGSASAGRAPAPQRYPAVGTRTLGRRVL